MIVINYHNITHCDQNNGDGLRVVLWLSGCSHHCKGCQNPITWDANGGIPFDDDAKREVIDELSKDYISGITFSGGDPLNENNLEGVLDLVNEIRLSFPEKTIWLYTGYCWEDVFEYKNPYIMCIDYRETCKADRDNLLRRSIVENVDVLVDGRYEEDKRDITAKWKGSTNQRVIDVAQSLAQNNIVLYCK